MFNVVKTARAVVASAAVLGLLAAGACGRTAGKTGGRPDAPATGARLVASAGAGSPVERGKYLVTITGCGDCHTPMKMGATGPEPDLSRFLGGHPQEAKLPPSPPTDGPWAWHGAATNTAFAGPWGVTYAINLTPHTHGMAAWTEEMFIRAMRTGKHMGESRPIQPPMPWPNVGKMTDADLKAMYTYLKSIPPVNNVVPDYEPPAGR